RAPSARWEPTRGWFEYNAQPEILGSGEFFLVDASQVERVQKEITAQYERAQRRFSQFG
ncbi:hypothetical protein JF737_19925, partial [Mycobacterium avium]|nr:hypothetical protein [Mycobacterium avium]